MYSLASGNLNIRLGASQMIKSNEKEMGRDLGRTLAVAIPTLVTVFPNSMVGNVKLAINQADPRVGAYDELVEEHSECDFITRGG